jgi:hypothetical protein
VHPPSSTSRSHPGLSELVTDGANPKAPRDQPAIRSGRGGMSRAALMEEMEPFLPVLRGFVLLQRRPATPTQWRRLLGRVSYVADAKLGRRGHAAPVPEPARRIG